MKKRREMDKNLLTLFFLYDIIKLVIFINAAFFSETVANSERERLINMTNHDKQTKMRRFGFFKLAAVALVLAAMLCCFSILTAADEAPAMSPADHFTIGMTNANGAYEKVGEITATVNGERIFLRNPAHTSPTVALIPIAVTAVFAFFLVRSCKIRYYMMQEDRADADEASDKQSE